MKRWAWNIFCLFSLLVFAGSVAIWIRTATFGETVQWASAYWDRTRQPNVFKGCRYTLAATHGCVGAWRTRYELSGHYGEEVGFTYHRGSPVRFDASPKRAANLVNFHLGDFQLLLTGGPNRDGWTTFQHLVLPLWLFLPAALPPVLWWRKWRKGKRRGFPVTLVGTANDETRIPESNPKPE